MYPILTQGRELAQAEPTKLITVTSGSLMVVRESEYLAQLNQALAYEEQTHRQEEQARRQVEAARARYGFD